LSENRNRQRSNAADSGGGVAGLAGQQAVAVQNTVRPTKKQQELLGFIQEFIEEHGYSPSYREVMSGLNYTSVATVSLHINNLIKRGHLVKRDRSARSLEVVNAPAKTEPKVVAKQLKVSEEKWLVEKVEAFFKEIEEAPSVVEKQLDHLYVLIGALKVLGLDGAAQSYVPRLSALKKRVGANEYAA
jgi:sulfur relay (sulfurtransferase) DsrC/TusE family protein